MHYDFKVKLNKLDSQRNRNLQVPEIDWKLNEAQDLYINLVAQPWREMPQGFERNQRAIDAVRTLVKSQEYEGECTQLRQVVTQTGKTLYYADYPVDYLYYIDSILTANQGACKNRSLSIIIRQHDDDYDNSYNSSSFTWKEVNALFQEKGIKIDVKDFEPLFFCLTYIRKPVRMSLAAAFRQGLGYNYLDGSAAPAQQDCELPEATHREIVDLAVAIASGDLEMPSYNIKQSKVQTNLI